MENLPHKLRVVLIGALFATGCASVQIGQQFDLDTFKTKVERGATTQTMVRSWLGSPRGTGMVVETTGNELEEWTYYFGSGKLPDLGKTNFSMLQIRFDKEGVVRGYSWSGP